MTGLKEKLMKEQSWLENIFDQAEARLKQAPPGSVRLSKRKNGMQYYHCLPGGKKNGTYIPRANRELSQRLAQKSYDEKVVKLAGRRLSQLKRLLKDYEDDEIERIYEKETRARKKLIQPAVLSWEQMLKTWSEKEYKGKEFMEDAPLILTDRGERVRSKSEKILADLFGRMGIPYKYECPLYLKGLGVVYPDFTFLSRKNRQEIYWEHDGKMDDPVYVQNAVRKIHAYETNHIYPGERLILTFETDKISLDTQLAEKLASHYLL